MLCSDGAYGRPDIQRLWRTRTKRGGRGWLPTPDPERAAMIQEIWDGLVINPEALQAELNKQAEQHADVKPQSEQPKTQEKTAVELTCRPKPE